MTQRQSTDGAAVVVPSDDELDLVHRAFDGILREDDELPIVGEKQEIVVNVDKAAAELMVKRAEIAQRLKDGGVELITIKNGPFKGRVYYKCADGRLVRKR